MQHGIAHSQSLKHSCLIPSLCQAFWHSILPQLMTFYAACTPLAGPCGETEQYAEYGGVEKHRLMSSGQS